MPYSEHESDDRVEHCHQEARGFALLFCWSHTHTHTHHIVEQRHASLSSCDCQCATTAFLGTRLNVKRERYHFGKRTLQAMAKKYKQINKNPTLPTTHKHTRTHVGGRAKDFFTTWTRLKQKIQTKNKNKQEQQKGTEILWRWKQKEWVSSWCGGTEIDPRSPRKPAPADPQLQALRKRVWSNPPHRGSLR